jgi:hypothetical protein
MQRYLLYTPLIAIVWALVFVFTRHAQADGGQDSERPLTRVELIQVWLLCFLNPVFNGLILYFGWKKRLPTMAKQVETAMIAALCASLLVVAFI